MKAARFEIYTTNPETGESGWGIKFRYVLGETVKEAREALKSTPNFDCVILFDFIVDIGELGDGLNGDWLNHLVTKGWVDKVN